MRVSWIHKWWDGTLWNDWRSSGVSTEGLTYTGVPAVVTLAPGRIDVFNTGSDGGLYHLVFDQGAWAKPEFLGSDVSASVSVIVFGPNQLLVAKYNGSHQPMTNFYQQGAWKGWSFVAGLPESGLGMLPNRYIFAVNEVHVITPRSLYGDTDSVQSTLNAGNWPVQSGTYTLENDLGGPREGSGATIENCSFGPVTVELCEAVIFNYQVMNTGDPSGGGSELASSGQALASAALSYITKAIGAGSTEISSVEIAGASSSVPVIGPILSLVGTWLLNKLFAIIQAKCDGLVAVEQIVKLGKDIQLLTASGPYTMTTTHPGTDSAQGCGPNSNYTVTWTITRA